MKLRIMRMIALVGALALVLAACGGDSGGDGETDATDASDTTVAEETPDEGDEGGGEMTGQVNLDGSSTVGPLSEVAAEAYMGENPDVRVTVAISGTGGGFEKFCVGETDANNSSRTIYDDEAAICEENGISYDYVRVANDALSIVVNAELPVECMTVEQVRQIWDADSTVQTWGDIEGLDLPDDVASQALTPYGPGQDSGTFGYFTEAINGEEARIRNDYVSIGEDDLAAVRAVEGDVYATGYIPYSYYQEAGDAVKAVAIDDGNGCVEATLENVQNQSYTPLGRGLFVYFSDTALARPEVLDFANFYVSNGAELAEIAEYVPMTPEQIEEELAKIETLAG